MQSQRDGMIYTMLTYLPKNCQGTEALDHVDHMHQGVTPRVEQTPAYIRDVYV